MDITLWDAKDTFIKRKKEFFKTLPYLASKIYLTSKIWMAKTIVAMQVSSHLHWSTPITPAAQHQSQPISSIRYPIEDFRDFRVGG